jgi:hypothetical protein
MEATKPNDSLARRARADDDTAEVRIAKVRERIRKNFPDERAALTWRKDSGSRIVSTCGRFAIERHGDGAATRYTAKLQPHSVIGINLLTADLAKDVCNRHASPLPLEDPARAKREAERYPDP